MMKSQNFMRLTMTILLKMRTSHSETKWAKGHLYALMGHLSCYIWALMATTEPGNCPRDPFSLPLKGHSQGWCMEAHFFDEEKGIFLNFKSL